MNLTEKRVWEESDGMIAERAAAAAATLEVQETVQTPPAAAPAPQAPPAAAPAQPTPLPAPESTPRRGSHGPRPRRSRRGASRSPMTAAVLAGAFLVTLLCIYVDAYARVTTSGFQLSLLRRDLQRAKQEEDVLRAQIGLLSLPNAVARRARELGMEATTPEMAVVLPAEDRRKVTTTPRSR